MTLEAITPEAMTRALGRAYNRTRHSHWGG